MKKLTKNNIKYLKGFKIYEFEISFNFIFLTSR